MDSRTIFIALLAVGALSLLRIFTLWRGNLRQRGRHVDWDEHFIQVLRKAGVNTFDDHDVDFFFTLPSRAACETVAALLRAEGYAVDVRDAPDSGQFSLHAQRRMRLIVADMQQLTARFTQLAESHGGKYDNWAVATR